MEDVLRKLDREFVRLVPPDEMSLVKPFLFRPTVTFFSVCFFVEKKKQSPKKNFKDMRVCLFFV